MIIPVYYVLCMLQAKKAAYECAKSHEKAEESKQGKAKTEKDINKVIINECLLSKK